MRLGDGEKALDLLNRALRIKERDYGKEHPQVALTLANLGIAHGEVGNQEKKADFLHRAQSILERGYGATHPQTLRVKKMIEEIDSTLKKVLDLLDPEIEAQIWSTTQVPSIDISTA